MCSGARAWLAVPVLALSYVTSFISRSLALRIARVAYRIAGRKWSHAIISSWERKQ